MRSLGSTWVQEKPAIDDTFIVLLLRALSVLYDI